jgi:hypothetical protein
LSYAPIVRRDAALHIPDAPIRSHNRHDPVFRQRAFDRLDHFLRPDRIIHARKRLAAVQADLDEMAILVGDRLLVGGIDRECENPGLASTQSW